MFADEVADAVFAIHIVLGKGLAEAMQFTQFCFHALQLGDTAADFVRLFY